MKMEYKNTTRGHFEALIAIHYKELSRRLYKTAEGINLTLYYVKSTTQKYPLHVGTWQKTGAWLDVEEASRLLYNTGE
jgi:hypothetical protein